MFKAWWSAKEPAAQITVVTGLNPSRLNQLESQCRSWRGPISAAVYVVVLHPDNDQPLPDAQQKRLDDAAAQVEAFHERWVALRCLLCLGARWLGVHGRCACLPGTAGVHAGRAPFQGLGACRSGSRAWLHATDCGSCTESKPVRQQPQKLHGSAAAPFASQAASVRQYHTTRAL